MVNKRQWIKKGVFMKQSIYKFIFMLIFSVATQNAINTGPVSKDKLHEWAAKTHREFWSLIGNQNCISYNGAFIRKKDSKEDFNMVHFYSPGGSGVFSNSFQGKSDIQILNSLFPKDSTYIFIDSRDKDRQRRLQMKLTPVEPFITMGADLHSAKFPSQIKANPKIKVWKVTTDSDFEKWLRICDERRNPDCFPSEYDLFKGYFSKFMPSKKNSTLQFYLASFEGRIVGTSCIQYSDDYVALYFVGVHPSFRSKGIGRLLSYIPLKEAKNAGYRWSVLQAQPLGVPVYPKIGFEKVGEISVFDYKK